MFRRRHARVLLATLALAVLASLGAAPAVAHGVAPAVVLAGPERCC